MGLACCIPSLFDAVDKCGLYRRRERDYSRGDCGHFGYQPVDPHTAAKVAIIPPRALTL
jgi:hypothetical protein